MTTPETSQAPQNVLDLVLGSTPADWHQHSNGGGWVYKTAKVAETAYVGPDARVYGNAWVHGDARVYGNAWVHGGEWKASPHYIQGTRHALTLCSPTQIAVGCHVHTIEEWLAGYKEIGAREGYTQDQVEEYGRYLTLLASRAKKLSANVV